jgi:hypothetical protein
LGHGFNGVTVGYYRNLQRFIHDSGVAFWTMTPQHALVSNESVNSCLAQNGTAYVAYILHDNAATVNLTSVMGTARCKLYDPKVGKWRNDQAVVGGGLRTFIKPAEADDWVIYVYSVDPSGSKW